MACGGWTAGKYLRDVLDIAIGTLQLERNNLRQEDLIMRRYCPILFCFNYV